MYYIYTHTHTHISVHVYRTRGCACVCGMVFRAFETQSNGLLLLPLQDVHLSLSLWSAGLRWYVFICLYVCVCMLLASGCGLVVRMYWEHRVHRHKLSRVCKCVPKQGTAAASPCAQLMKKITQVIPMQMNEASLFFCPLSFSPEYPVQTEEGGQAVLNCFLPWHRLLLGRTEYHYSWAPGEPGTKKVPLPSLDVSQTCIHTDT